VLELSARAGGRAAARAARRRDHLARPPVGPSAAQIAQASGRSDTVAPARRRARR
jgi:hypothetical protein